MKNSDRLTRFRFRRLACWNACLVSVFAAIHLHAQTGPFPVTNWPPTIDASAPVDYAILDPNAVFDNTPAGWNAVLTIPNGGDQPWQNTTIGGFEGVQETGNYLNIADPDYLNFETNSVIDILLQVYGNSSLYTSTGAGANINFLEGQVAVSFTANVLAVNPLGGPIPAGADNSQWNWMLLEITNAIDANDGNRYVGDPNYPGDGVGGVNGGTMRIQGVGPGFTIRAIAFGPQGAFGTTNQVNVFPAATACAPEPAVNLAFVDFNQKITNNLVPISDSGQGFTFTVQSGVGPSNDKRTAIQVTGSAMNFEITSNYLGLPCNAPHPMKVCVEFYDDPALAGNSFGPASYSTDAQGDAGTYSGPLYTMTGTGQWLKLAFWIPSVDLFGVNVASATGGPTISFTGPAPLIDRFELGVVRSGTNALAGQDPDPTYFLDPDICNTNYGYYAEWDPHDGITNNLDVGGSGGDQQMVVQLAGPANDMRLAEAPAPGSGNNNIQFALQNSVFGPAYQDNSIVSMLLTYYDDPALVGSTLFPNAYYTMNYGNLAITTAPAQPTSVTLQGTGTWQNAYFVMTNVNFTGVNQAYSVVRFETSLPTNNTTGTEASIFISRIRFDVVRPCGPFEGINMFQTIGITSSTNAGIAVNWSGTATLQSAANLSGPYKTATSVTNTLNNSFSPAGGGIEFFRLAYPPYPTYLSASPIFPETP
ncbi:MAG TPA: hypothetical protein VGO67_07090 [Verrucomicrobiae bacterium]|jgi:hypothetical protein